MGVRSRVYRVLNLIIGQRCNWPVSSKSAIDRIYDVIREMIPASGKNTLKMSEIKERCLSKGFKPDKIEECITEYERLNILISIKNLNQYLESKFNFKIVNNYKKKLIMCRKQKFMY